jgi:hypothetical protein
VIGWSTVAPGLRSLFSAMASDTAYSPEFRAMWGEGKQEMVHPQVGMRLTLKVTSIVGDGLDELRHENITVTPEEGDPYTMLEERVVGHRRFTLQCRVESHFHDQDDDVQAGWCWTMTERLRTSIRRTRNREALEALNIALVDIAPATDVSLTFDKRRINAAVVDFFLQTAFSDADPIPLGWIERILLTSQVKDVIGEAIQPPLTFTDKSIPEP